MRRPWKTLTIGLLLVALLPTTVVLAARSQANIAPLAAVNRAAPGPYVRLYIQTRQVDETDLLDMRRRLIANGVKNVNYFVNDKIIACEAPATMDVAALIGDSRFDVVDASAQTVAAAARAGVTGSGLGFVDACYRLVELRRTDAAALPATMDGFNDVVLTVPRETVRASKRPAGLSAAAGESQQRSIQQNTEFLAGDILIAVILPESEGHGEDWTDQAVADARQGALAACLAYQQMFGIVPMHFIFTSQVGVPTAYEPIQTGMDEHYIWVMDLMDELGIPRMQDDLLMTHEYNNRNRQYYKTNWAFTAFVANSEHALNHRFADQFYTAYANLGGPYMVIPYPAGENPFLIDQVLVYSTVFQHEMGHIFWALDEYPSELNLSSCGSYTGYLNYPNKNKVSLAMDGTFLYCPGHEVELCIMWRAKEDLGRPVCSYTAGQIGVVDNNRNSVPDVYDMPPTIEFETARVETIRTPNVTVNMTAISLPVENHNPFQAAEERTSYAAPLKDAWLKVNGVGPVHLKPLDGSWGDVEEDLSISLTGIPVGVTQIAVTAQNVAGRTSEPVVKSLYFAGIQYALFDIDVREKGINLSWSTVGDEFDTRLDLYRIDAASGSSESTLLASNMQPKAEHSLYKLFEYFDTDVKPGNEYKYFVRGYFTMEYPDTTIEYQADSQIFSARSMFPITSNSLTSNVSPNPFRDAAHISVRVPSTVKAGQSGGTAASVGSVPVRTDVEIRVYDVAGRFVKEVYRGREFGGVQTFTWDGTNSKNERVPSGIYFIKTVAGPSAEVKKVVLVR